MSQKVQELIDKIKNEGIHKAEESAERILDDAKKEAQTIIQKAQQEAEQAVTNARQEAEKIDQTTRQSLKQASRDTILSLRQEIEKTLNGIIKQDVGKSLSDASLNDILTGVITSAIEGKADQDVEIMVPTKQLDQVKNDVLGKLSKQLKSSIKLNAAQDMNKGFAISFDEGKSSYDFSDEALAEYL